MTIFTCENDLDAMMTCLYDAWASGLGHRRIRLMIEPVLEPELFCDYHHIDADHDKAAKVIRSIQKKISSATWHMVYRCAMASGSEKLDIIYRFLLYGLSY